jgi:hypothetical protein
MRQPSLQPQSLGSSRTWRQGKKNAMSSPFGLSGRLARWTTASAVVLIFCFAGSARAGTYVVAQCSPNVNPDAADASYTASTTHFKPFVDCSASGPGLQIRHQLSTGETGTVQGAYGAWVWQAPSGTFITGGSTFSRLATEDGIHGYLAVSTDNGESVSYENQNDDQGHTSGIPPGNWRYLVARLQCTQPNEGNRCVGNAGGAHTYVKQARIQVTDVAPPTMALAGSMFSGAVLRGPQDIQLSASDQGSGIHSVQVAVNGKNAAGDDLSASCNPAPGNLTTRLVPCPTSFSKTYTLDTASGPFVEGSNSITVCVYDYAQTGTANSVCETKEVVVDNLCPGSTIGGGEKLAAGFGNGKTERTLAFRKRALIRGKLRDGGGNPVSGATICVEGHTDLEGRPFHLIGTTTTNENGGWTFKLKHGPSRVIRIAYRAGSFQTTSDLVLHMRARSTFHINVHRTCVHRRIYFSGAVAGPQPAGRVVYVVGKVPGSKRTYPVREASTDALGHWRAAYAFTPVSRTTRFEFWVVVPKQAEYAYEKGHSVHRYIRVHPGICKVPRHHKKRHHHRKRHHQQKK